MRKHEKLILMLNDLKKTRFTGFIRINYSQGGITRIEKNEDVLNKVCSDKEFRT